MTSVRIRLRSGSREIELEGPRLDVDALLERWWLSGEQRQEQDEDAAELSEPRSGRTNRESRPKAKRAKVTPNGGVSPLFDVQAVVNKMREDVDYELFEQKVLHEKDSLNKLKLVCWFTRAELTTGEIAKILQELGVKIEQSNVSHTLRRARSEFLQDGVRRKGAIVRYRLAGKSNKDFETWLRKG